MRAKTLQSSIRKLDIDLACREVVHTAIDNPPAFLADPRLFLREVENEIENLCPFCKWYFGLEEDGRFDNRFCAEETAEEVVALLLY